MSIWFQKEVTLGHIREMGNGTMIDHVGIEWTAVGPDHLQARMPVDRRTTQPYGYLHGGASCVLAETMGSLASALVIDPAQFICMGLDINANHLRAVREGYVYGTVKPLHIGGTTHVWDIRITDEQDRLVCISRLTVAILKKKDQAGR